MTIATTFTPEEVKVAAQIAVTDYDALLPVYIATVEHQLEQFTGLTLTSRTETIRVPGKWHPNIFLPGRPISAVTAVRIWQDAFADSLWTEPVQTNFMGQNTSFTGTPPTALTIGVDYGVDFNKVWANRKYSLSGMVIRNGQSWPGVYERRRGRLKSRKIDGQDNIEVTYTYGFVDKADLPPVFLTAVAAGVVALIQRVPSGGLINTSNGLDGASLGLSLDIGAQNAAGLLAPDCASIRVALLPYVAPRVL